MKRFAMTASVVMSLFLLVVWVVYPIIQHGKGTSRGISVEVVQQPFIEGETLIYRWTGEVWRSCPVTIRRSVIDSEGVVTQLLPSTFTAPGSSGLGVQSYEIEVDVPSQIPEGPAIYQAFEIPSCDYLQRLFPVAIAYPEVHFTVAR